VRIPDAQRLGEVGEGWQVSITTLMNERLAVGEAPPPDAAEILDLARRIDIDGHPALDDSAVREKIADWYVEAQGLKHTRSRIMTASPTAEPPAPKPRSRSW
jgi:alkylation response protein AidB-like acyl-CoA dehydrogenase